MEWGLYEDSITTQGNTRRERIINQTQRSITKRAQRSPAYKTVLIDGEKQDVVITSSTEMYHKKINAMPNEHIYAGSIVEWNNAHYIITNADTEDEVYQRGEMYQCNVYLKWQNEDGKILGRYGYATDVSMFAEGTNYKKVIDSLEQIYSVQLPLDEETVKLRRDKRFIIDVFTGEPQAYLVTNRNVISYNYHPVDINESYKFNGKDKLLKLTLTETQLSDKDNRELMIADYFDPTETDGQVKYNCEIKYSGKPEIKIGGSFKNFTAVFTNEDGNILDVAPQWHVNILTELERYFTITYEEDKLKIKVSNNSEVYGAQIKIEVDDGVGNASAELYVRVVNLYG